MTTTLYTIPIEAFRWDKDAQVLAITPKIARENAISVEEVDLGEKNGISMVRVVGKKRTLCFMWNNNPNVEASIFAPVTETGYEFSPDVLPPHLSKIRIHVLTYMQ